MTPEEITKLSRSLCATSNPTIDDVWFIEDIIDGILRTHCIVSKEKATDLCRLTLEHGDSVDYGLIDGLTDIVCDIFSEQYHQVAEGLDNSKIAKEVEQ